MGRIRDRFRSAGGSSGDSSSSTSDSTSDTSGGDSDSSDSDGGLTSSIRDRIRNLGGGGGGSSDSSSGSTDDTSSGGSGGGSDPFGGGTTGSEAVRSGGDSTRADAGGSSGDTSSSDTSSETDTSDDYGSGGGYDPSEEGGGYTSPDDGSSGDTSSSDTSSETDTSDDYGSGGGYDPSEEGGGYTSPDDGSSGDSSGSDTSGGGGTSTPDDAFEAPDGRRGTTPDDFGAGGPDRTGNQQNRDRRDRDGGQNRDRDGNPDRQDGVGDPDRRTETSGILDDQTDYSPEEVEAAREFEDRINEEFGITDRRNYDITRDGDELTVEFSEAARGKIAKEQVAEETGYSEEQLAVGEGGDVVLDEETRDSIEDARQGLADSAFSNERARSVQEAYRDPMETVQMSAEEVQQANSRSNTTERTAGPTDGREGAQGGPETRAALRGPVNQPSLEAVARDQQRARVSREQFGDVPDRFKDEERVLDRTAERTTTQIEQAGGLAIDPDTAAVAPTAGGPGFLSGFQTAARAERLGIDIGQELTGDQDSAYVQDGEGAIERGLESFAGGSAAAANPIQIASDGLEVGEFVATQPQRQFEVDTDALDTFNEESLRFEEPTVRRDDAEAEEFNRQATARAAAGLSQAQEDFQSDPASFTGGALGRATTGFAVGTGTSTLARSAVGRAASSDVSVSGGLRSTVDRVGFQQRQLDPDDPSPLAGGPQGGDAFDDLPDEIAATDPELDDAFRQKMDQSSFAANRRAEQALLDDADAAPDADAFERGVSGQDFDTVTPEDYRTVTRDSGQQGPATSGRPAGGDQFDVDLSPRERALAQQGNQPTTDFRQFDSYSPQTRDLRQVDADTSAELDPLGGVDSRLTPGESGLAETVDTSVGAGVVSAELARKRAAESTFQLPQPRTDARAGTGVDVRPGVDVGVGTDVDVTPDTNTGTRLEERTRLGTDLDLRFDQRTDIETTIPFRPDQPTQFDDPRDPDLPPDLGDPRRPTDVGDPRTPRTPDVPEFPDSENKDEFDISGGGFEGVRFQNQIASAQDFLF